MIWPLNLTANKKVTRIAIIDTGFGLHYKLNVKLCKTGHYDFVKEEPRINGDDVGHGTAIALVVAQNIKKPYCLLVYRVIKTAEGTTYPSVLARAIYKAYKEGANYINYSITGGSVISEEKYAMELVSKEGVKVFVAAGNNGQNLDKNCDAYPACYKVGNYVVGALNDKKKPANYSNYGKVITHWELGRFGSQTGTSMATPRAIVRDINENVK